MRQQTHHKENSYKVVSKMLFLAKEYRTHIIIAILSFLWWILVYTLFHKQISTRPNETIFTNPALNYRELEEMYTSNKIINLSKEIDDYAAFKKYIWELTYLSVYFRNLNNGWAFWVNQNEKFSPASLMKLPILITYLKKSEEHPELLEKKFIYKRSINEYRQMIKPGKQLIEGMEYSIREMCEYMIKYSDNNASSFLERLLNQDDLKKTYEDIGIEFPNSEEQWFENNVRIIDYAGFFRVLFNASYLNRENSEKALSLLNQIEFEEGIRRWIPDYIKTAHKFGERTMKTADNKEEKQLHDCWIVYYPNHPYIICIMTRWYDLEILKETITNVSKTVYHEILKQYGENPLDIIENEIRK
jgi:beta-lactamase class A